MRKLKVSIANVLWFLYSAWMAWKWKRACSDVAGTQKAVLQHILSSNADSEFGRAHHFTAIETIEAYGNSVPLHSYEELQPYIQRVAEGHPKVLTGEKVQQFVLTSGSTQASKLIPYTKTLISEFQAGIDPWVYYLFRVCPHLLLGKAYWSVTPIGERQGYSSGGIPIGFDDEQMYFSPLTRWVLDTIMIGPSQLAHLQDIEIFRYVTLRLLLQERSLMWVSVWNPSFLTLLLDPLSGWFSRLVNDIRHGTLSTAAEIEAPVRNAILARCTSDPKRAGRLEAVYAAWQGKALTEPNEAGRTFFEEIWPGLRLISCWAHGNAALALPHLKAHFPHATIQPKGLLATEAFISFPFTDDLSALSLLSHFFEFEETEMSERTVPVIRQAHELQPGKIYSVIVTTGGGLYRYRLNDLIEVAGFHKQCPLIRFLGRQAKVVDICGEKLNEDYVQSVVSTKLKKYEMNVTFWMMAPECPDETQPHYTLFIQLNAHGVYPVEKLRIIASETDEALQESYHYGYCRRMGQLDSCRLFVIAPNIDASHTYLTVSSRLGQRLGDIKATALQVYQKWSQEFPGIYA